MLRGEKKKTKKGGCSSITKKKKRVRERQGQRVPPKPEDYVFPLAREDLCKSENGGAPWGGRGDIMEAWATQDIQGEGLLVARLTGGEGGGRAAA